MEYLNNFSDFAAEVLELRSMIATAALALATSYATSVVRELWLKKKSLRVEKRTRLDEEQPRTTETARPRRSLTANAELILHLLLTDDEAEAVGGDLQERYSKKIEKMGKRRASIWLWSQVLRSTWPLLKRFITAGGFLAAAEFIRKLLS